ncbi:hypothetical protein KKB43_01460 [Patescibacteria group bacterium]|nr:hypothetical protein [Patescibacteria group bacterium]MBU4579663.1 hypothetical protein [Patescibacteria group bacterium]
MKTLNFKKPILAIIFLLAIFAGIGIVYSAAKEGKGIVKFLNGPTPSVTNAFIDKEKYFPGDIMDITVETKDALKVKALVENEVGFNEVNLVVTASFEDKETWKGKWKVENSQEGKKYKIKIIASNKSGTTETVLEWEDPNPGHPWTQIDNFPAACGAGQFVNQIGNPPTCATPAGGSPTTWTCNDFLSGDLLSGGGNSCPSGALVLGACQPPSVISDACDNYRGSSFLDNQFFCYCADPFKKFRVKIRCCS